MLTQITSVNQLVYRLVTIGNAVIYLLVGLAVIYITWSVVQYFVKGKEGDTTRKEAGMQILWGIVGLAIILSLWGLVNILISTFGTNTYNLNGRLPNADFLNSNASFQNVGGGSSCPPGDYDPSCFPGSSYSSGFQK